MSTGEHLNAQQAQVKAQQGRANVANRGHYTVKVRATLVHYMTLTLATVVTKGVGAGLRPTVYNRAAAEPVHKEDGGDMPPSHTRA